VITTAILPVSSAGRVSESSISSSKRSENLIPASRPSRGRGIPHSKEVLCTLGKWFFDHRNNPYPSGTDKSKLRESTGLDKQQICNCTVGDFAKKTNDYYKKT